MTSVDVELALVGLVAMLEPATLGASVLALVLGDRPLRTGFWFYVGGLGATLAVLFAPPRYATARVGVPGHA